MALNFRNVQNAYVVFNELRKTVLPELVINSFPEDMYEWDSSDKENPQLNRVYGFDRKADSGWENLVFFVENPTPELKSKFEELKDKVDNSSMFRPYRLNRSLYIIGFF